MIGRLQYTGDLDSMINRGYIRALVPMNRTHYFLDGARQRGLIYEQMKHFEKYLNRKLKRKDEFITSHGRGTLFGNVIYNRYLKENVWIEKPVNKIRQPVNYVISILKNYIIYKSMSERFESRKEAIDKFEHNTEK